MSNQSIQPVQIKSAPANLYTYNPMQVHSGFATVNAVQKKEKTSISSIFNWKKEKNRTTPEQSVPTLYGQHQFHQATYPVVQYAPAPNYIIDSNQKFMHYNSIYKPTAETGYLQFPSTIHATIRYLPNHKQRTNILATNWEPAATTITYPTSTAYPHPHHPHNSSVNGHQPITLQHEITYSEQITIAQSCLPHACLNKNQSCKCYNENKNYFLVPTNSSLLESSTKLHNKSTDCMLPNKKLSLSQAKQSSIKGSKSHHNLNLDDCNTQLSSKKKSNKFAATVNERFLRIFKKSIKDPFNTVKSSRKSILDCDLTAYDLVAAAGDEEELKKANTDNVNGKLNINQKSNLDSSLEEDDEDQLDENQFETNFIQAKAKQKQHYYSPFKAIKQETNQTNQSNKEDKNCTKNLNSKIDFEEDRWSNDNYLQELSAKPNLKAKFDSCRIAGKGIKFTKRMSILESDLSKEFLKEELSEDEDLNRLDKYAQNFDNLDKQEKKLNLKSTKLTKFDDLNNFRLFSSSVHNSSIPNLPDPDYDTDDEDDDRHTLTMFSRSTPDLDQSLENERRKKTTFTNTTSLYNLDQSSFKDQLSCLPPPPLPKSRSQQLIFNNSIRQTIQSPGSPSSSTYSSFNSSINSNVKSILKKSNPNLILLEHLKTVDLFDKKSKNAILNFNDGKNLFEETRLNKRCSSNKSVSTFKGNNEKKSENCKPKKSVHFRSSFNDELIVEHIHNQELIEEEEQIYDDIVMTRLKQSIDNEQNSVKNIVEHIDKNEKNDKNNDKNSDENSDKNTIINKNEAIKEEKDESEESSPKLNNLEGKKYSYQSPEILSNTTKLNSDEYFDALSTNDENENKKSSFLGTGKFNNSSLIKDRSNWKTQSSQLPKVNSSFEFKRSQDSSELNKFFKTKSQPDDLDELQSTALVKQNRKQLNIDNTKNLLKQSIVHSSSSSSEKQDKNLNFLQSLTKSTNLSLNLSNNSTSNLISNLSTNLKSNNTKEDNPFNQDKNDTQQMSPSSSSSTSAYVSLYASSSFSSAGSSSSNYSTSGFNENSNSSKFDDDSLSKKISRSAILDSLVNRKHNNKLIDKPLLKPTNKSNQDKQVNRENNEENKIVIDISMNNNYDSLNQTNQNEHIYEELNECSFEREINMIDNLNNNLNSVKKSIFEGASKDQIIEYLVDAKERIQELLINNYNEQYSSQQNKFSSLSTSCHNIASNRANRRNRVSNLSNVSSDSSSSSDILITTNSISNSIGQHLERNDSGVGTETSLKCLDIRMSKSEACLNELIDNHVVHSSHFDDHVEDNEDENILNNRKTANNSGVEEQICADCDQQNVCAEINEKTGLIYYPLLCSKCDKRRTERKEIIAEFVDTEFKYGRDLRIIREEFYRPMEIAGLLTKDQLKSVFLNLEELIQVNSKFSEKLQDAIDIATEQGDEDYTTVDIGKLFNESCDMLKSFETYCIKQASASRLLGQLEKDKEFLRIFLRVSQMENVLLRRMNLSAFLMVPVQRVTKYPLLLNRLFKVTPYHHNDRGRLKEAQLKVEMHLEQINQQTKGTVPNKIWRRISNLSNNSTSKRSNLDELGDIKLKKFNSSVRELFKAFKGSSRS